jgi:single-strand DNA-binding protein
MLNTVVLIGRLTRDPELRYTQNGIGVCTFNVAVNRPYKDQSGEKQADFIDVVAWRQLAENVANYMTKGRLVAVEGRIQTRTYENQEGQKRKAVEVVANNVRFLDKNPESKPTQNDDKWDKVGQPVPNNTNDDDIPF